ncbi:23S rRNA (uracil(1939)-C(5))-methyltransferase RlmD [Geomonas agri]|uniref:23S rRNA (uracil(1939)-C(5))-methyltransferase RlmD n=1 Tax=Geomonas agri TaxID=2873702 RepID=UPI001CD7ED92|nr:23S rRNA (uracil(1939)-C(5))-methyltransferase RlmD [Geomonas agri]
MKNTRKPKQFDSPKPHRKETPTAPAAKKSGARTDRPASADHSTANKPRSTAGKLHEQREHAPAKSAKRTENKGTDRQAKGRTSDRPRTQEERQPTLRSGQVLEVQIQANNDEAYGVAYNEGTRILVAGGIAGETLVVKITYVGRRESFANIIKILKRSPDRAPSPACTMGRACDGCGLMQMNYPAQLTWKKGLVARQIRKYPSLSDAVIHDTIASPNELGYRNTAKLVVAGKNIDPVIGIYRRNSHDVLEIADCALHHPLINKVVKAAKAGIKKGKVQIYNPKSEMGLLRYLVVRVAEQSNKVMVVFVTTDEGYNEMHHLAKFIQQAVPEVAVVAQNINTSTGNVIFGHKDRSITKAQTLKAYIGDKSFNLSPHSFFQVNSGAARIIYEKVRDFARLTGKERVIDLYCGIGGISLFLADRAREVVGIEVVDAAVADATANAAMNRADNCSFEAGDAVHLIDEIGEEGGADLIVLNPPRKGCDEKVLKSVASIKPQRIIYVSCSPETLARDLDILAGLGYKTLEIQPVDMFPQTVHVEDVALLEKL